MPIADPRSWEVLTYGDETAFLDFIGSHELLMRQFQDYAVRVLGLPTYSVLPLGDYTGPEWHDVDQMVHEGLASSLGLPAPIDLRSYDLSDRDQFASWTWLHAQDMVRLRLALGL